MHDRKQLCQADFVSNKLETLYISYVIKEYKALYKNIRIYKIFYKKILHLDRREL